MSSVVIVTGAGASYDCATRGGSGVRPPLVKTLFSDSYADTLSRYPLVLQAAADIRRATQGASDTAVPLEDFLREQMRASTSPHTQRRYRQVPLYLQEVLTRASGWTNEPDNYNALVNGALELESALFLTLNYDTLLDDRFAAYSLLEDLNWYVTEDSRWALVKLHGSVNWGFPIALDPERQYAPSVEWANLLIDELDELPEFDANDIVLRKHFDVAQKRLDGSGVAAPTVYYPALAVPLGQQDDLICPSTHVEAAMQRLTASDGLNILVVGYSGLDQEVLRLLAESGNSVRTMLVANNSADLAKEAATRIVAAFGGDTVQDEWVTTVGFTDLVRDGVLHRWLADLR